MYSVAAPSPYPLPEGEGLRGLDSRPESADRSNRQSATAALCPSLPAVRRMHLGTGSTPSYSSFQRRTVRRISREPHMFDRIFSAALAFCVLAGGTLAVGTAM